MALKCEICKRTFCEYHAFKHHICGKRKTGHTVLSVLLIASVLLLTLGPVLKPVRAETPKVVTAITMVCSAGLATWCWVVPKQNSNRAAIQVCASLLTFKAVVDLVELLVK